MEKIKDFFSSPKKTAILGLIGSILMLSDLILYFNMYSILKKLYVIGLAIYFFIILVRMFAKKGSLKFANYTLIILYIIHLILSISFGIESIFTVKGVIYMFLFIIPTLYFFNILLGKKNFVNNKLFAITVIIYTLIDLILIIHNINLYDIFTGVTYIINEMAYLLIIPYFYNYYNILKGGKFKWQVKKI